MRVSSERVAIASSLALPALSDKSHCRTLLAPIRPIMPFWPSWRRASLQASDNNSEGDRTGFFERGARLAGCDPSL